MAIRGVDCKWYDGFFLSMLLTSVDFGWQQRYARFCGRAVVLSILSLLLYRFLWAWTIIGTLCFTSLPEEGQKWGFLIWLLFSYSGLLCIACMSMGKWLTRGKLTYYVLSREFLFQNMGFWLT